VSCTPKYALVLGLDLATTPALADSAPNRDSLSAEVDAAIRLQMTEQHVSGISLAVVRDGRIIKATGYGLANLEVRAPVTPRWILRGNSRYLDDRLTSIVMTNIGESSELPRAGRFGGEDALIFDQLGTRLCSTLVLSPRKSYRARALRRIYTRTKIQSANTTFSLGRQ
jgi:hypothetical protein